MKFTVEKFVPRTLHKLQVLPLVNYNYAIKVGGKKVIVPIIKGIGFSNLYLSELWMLRILKALLPLKPGLFVDVGINLGQTLIKFKSLFPQQEYIGFEPNPLCVFYCKELIARNHFSHTQIVPAGLSDQSDIVVLNGFGATGSIDSAATIIDDFRPDEKITCRQFVPVYKFEDVAASLDLGKIGFLKIDVEGAEWLVLSGLKKRIAGDRPFIGCEILPVGSTKDTARLERQQKIESLLQELNYELYRVFQDRRVEKLATIEMHDNMEWCEYLFVASEDAEAFVAALEDEGVAVAS